MRQIFIALCVLTLLGAGCATTKKWQAFVYVGGLDNLPNTVQTTLDAAGPQFDTKDECLSWAAAKATTYDKADYICGYNCREEYGEIICETDAR